MPITKEQYSKPAISAEPEDIIKDLVVPKIAENNLSAEFDEDTLMLYLANYYTEPSITVEQAGDMTVKHALSRYNRRPGSGHKDEQAGPMNDDPVGIRKFRIRQHARMKRFEAAKKRVETKLNDELSKPVEDDKE